MSKVTVLRPVDDEALPWEKPAVPVPIVVVPAEPAAAPEHEPEHHPDSAAAPSPPADEHDAPPFPFTLLGHDHGVYYYLGHGTQQVTMLKANQHNALNLMQLAPISFWGRRWPAKRGFDDSQAASDLITQQHAMGIYDPTRQRGRGAWWDKKLGGAIVHLGDKLLIDGAAVGLYEHGTQNIYECAVPIPVDIDEPLRTTDAHKLAQICDYLSWESPLFGRLLAGWIVCAQVCGALRWKPNVWLSGPAASGKSTVVDHIVARALGKNRLAVVGGTTEASLRSILRADAMPVVMDDLDSSGDRSRQANQAILALMRVFSSEDGGDLAKASQTGGAANVYRVHSCYIFCSIVVEADKTADKSRIAMLKLLARKFETGQLEELHAKIREALPDDFAPRFYARCISLIPVIRKNAETFAKAIGSITGQQRCGDLYGHLFAGAYSLNSMNLITLEQATSYIGSREDVLALMTEQKQDVEENHEGQRCLSHLLEQVITDTDDGRMMRASIFDLIKESQNALESSHRLYLLRRNGIIVKNGRFYVANDHTQLRDLYRNSAWPTGWAGVLKSIPSAKAEAPISFGGRVTRSTSLPLSHLLQTEPPH